MVRKIFLMLFFMFCFGFFLSTQTFAQTYTGLWVTPLAPGTYAQTIDDGNLIITVILDLEGEYIVLLGQLEGTTGTFTNLFPKSISASGTFEYTSSGNAIATIDSCSGDCESLDFPIGLEIPFTKMWPADE